MSIYFCLRYKTANQHILLTVLAHVDLGREEERPPVGPQPYRQRLPRLGAPDFLPDPLGRDEGNGGHDRRRGEHGPHRRHCGRTDGWMVGEGLSRGAPSASSI